MSSGANKDVELREILKEQHEVLLAFMKRHGDLATKKNDPQSKVHWRELVVKLNAMGNAKKELQWRKLWSDLKCYVRKKKRFNLANPDNACRLNEFDKKIDQFLETSGQEREIINQEKDNEDDNAVVTTVHKDGDEEFFPEYYLIEEVVSEDLEESAAEQNCEEQDSAERDDAVQITMEYCKNTRISPDQFKIMVDYIERNGDFSSKSQNCLSPGGWNELVKLLNANGNSKTMSKWRKTWSDQKTQIKNKCIRITEQKGLCSLELTDIEKRVVKIMNRIAGVGDRPCVRPKPWLSWRDGESSKGDEESCQSSSSLLLEGASEDADNNSIEVEDRSVSDESDGRQSSSSCHSSPNISYKNQKPNDDVQKKLLVAKGNERFLMITYQQLNVMLSYMEIYGDLSEVPPDSEFKHIESRLRWDELTEILNTKGDPRTCEQWQMSWEMIKSNTLTKNRRFDNNKEKNLPSPIETHTHTPKRKETEDEILSQLPETEKRVLYQPPPIDTPKREEKVDKTLSQLSETERRIIRLIELPDNERSNVEDDSINIRPVVTMKTNTKPKNKPSIRLAPLTDMEKRILQIVGEPENLQASYAEGTGNDFDLTQDLSDDDTSNRPVSPLFCEVEEDICLDPDKSPKKESTTDTIIKPRTRKSINLSKRRHSLTSESSCSTYKSKKKSKSAEDNVVCMAEKFLKYGRQRDEREHEREIARIKQSEKMLSVFDRAVGVLERLAPSIQRLLDKKDQ